jgi:hypothetical protein
MAVSTDGRREIVGLGIGPSEAEPFWSAFLKSLVKRGLNGVKLGRTRVMARRSPSWASEISCGLVASDPANLCYQAC